MGLLASYSSGQFYYGSDGPIPLKIDSLKVSIRFDETVSPQAQEALISSIGRIDEGIDDDHMIDDFTAYSLTSGTDYDAFLDSLDTLDGVYLVEPYYISASDSPMVVGESFAVAFDTTYTYEQIDSINAAFKVVVDHELYGMLKVFWMRNTDSSGYRVLELSNSFHVLNATRYAHPEFGVRAVKFGYKLFDYYHPYQFHTKKVIGDFNSKSVWDFAGLNDSLIVAVLDDGLDEHEDLPPVRLISGYDFAQNDETTIPGTDEAHGMGCGGIIGSSHTTDSLAGLQSESGVISLNPHVKLFSVKIFKDDGGGITALPISEAVSYAKQNGAHILSNSWGFRHPDFEEQVLTDALTDAFLNGRGGLGCPVIFSAGNGATVYPGRVAYPAKLWSCFAVGATQLNDYR